MFYPDLVFRAVPAMYLPMKNNTEIANLIKRFRYAFRGLKHAINNERNMRIHIVVALLVGFFSFLYGLSPGQYAIIFLCFGFVITSEMFNTAIEALVNLESPTYDNLARIAKDVAAGAVFVSAVAAVIVALFTFDDWKRIGQTFLVIGTTPVYLISFLVIILIGCFFIFGCNGKVKPQNKKTDNYK